jgi:hypothetical protein
MIGWPPRMRFGQKKRPPQDKPWVWLTKEMLESEAWAAMPLAARKVVERSQPSTWGTAAR